MATLRKARAGHKAKSQGLIWERQIEYRAARQGITVVRIPDSCRVVRGPAGVKLLRINSPFDYVLLRATRAIVLDAKTTDSDTFSYSQIIPHQLASLIHCRRDAFAAGYLVHFRPSSRVVFYTTNILETVRPRQSLRPEDGIDLGSPASMELVRLFGVYPIDSEPYPTEV